MILRQFKHVFDSLRPPPSIGSVARRPLILATLPALLAAGCTLGPQPDRPGLAIDLDAPYAGASDTGESLEAVAGWWRRFGDEATSDLVARVVAGNYDLKAAAARVRQAAAASDVTRDGRFPAIGANFAASGRNIPDSQTALIPVPVGPGGTPLSTGGGSTGDDFVDSYDLSIDVSWQLDLFGRLRRLEQAADFEAVATEADRLALLHTLVAQTITGRVAVATLGERLALAEANLDSLRQTLETVEQRYQAGVGDAVELRLARENVATAQAQIPPLQSQLDQQRFALAVLTGERPGAVGELPDTLPPLPELPPPPLGLPASLLDRRPDLLSSEFRARAATARVGAAIADLFPDLRLTGSYGFTGDQLGSLIGGSNEVYSIIGSVAQPIYEGGRRRSEVRRSRAAADEQAANYAADVLNAFQEVDAALVRERAGRAEVEASATALTEAQAAEELARSSYSRGVGNLLQVFEAERRRRAAEERLALARQGVWTARIDLHLALGGDWDLPEQQATTQPDQR